MSAREIGTQLVQLCNEGRAEEVVKTYYSPDIVSIEGGDSGAIPARIEGMAALDEKNAWWYANHEVHGMTATGPFIGHRPDQFVVGFEVDMTPKGGERMQMTEVGIYTVRGGKIVQEEFLYSTQ